MNFLVGMLYIPVGQYGTYVYEPASPEELKKFVATENPVVLLAKDEQDKVEEYTGISLNNEWFTTHSPRIPFRELSVGDVVFTCRFAALSGLVNDPRDKWEIAKLTKVV